MPTATVALADLEHLLHASVDQEDVVLLTRADRLGQEPLRAVVHRDLERPGDTAGPAAAGRPASGADPTAPRTCPLILADHRPNTNCPLSVLIVSFGFATSCLTRSVLAEVAVGVVAVPAIGLRRVERPAIAHAPVRAEFEVVEVVLARRVVQEVHDRQREIGWIQVERLNRRPVAVACRRASGSRTVIGTLKALTGRFRLSLW